MPGRQRRLHDQQPSCTRAQHALQWFLADVSLWVRSPPSSSTLIHAASPPQPSPPPPAPHLLVSCVGPVPPCAPAGPARHQRHQGTDCAAGEGWEQPGTGRSRVTTQHLAGRARRQAGRQARASRQAGAGKQAGRQAHKRHAAGRGENRGQGVEASSSTRSQHVEPVNGEDLGQERDRQAVRCLCCCGGCVCVSSPGQFCSLGVPSAANILPNWSISAVPGSQGLRSSSSGRSTAETHARTGHDRTGQGGLGQ